MTPPRSTFQAGGPLPTGVVALEASAGTGKTFALSSLAARFVAERDVPASGLCIVSFTEAATAELRGRVRSRLVEAHDHLAAGAPGVDDAVLTAIADVGGDDTELTVRRQRLAVAIGEFDAATISTIHGFCSRVLAGTGSGADLSVDDGRGDVAEVVNDLVIARFARTAPDWLKPNQIRLAVEARLAMPDVQMRRPSLTPSSKHASEPERRERSVLVADVVDQAVEMVHERRRVARRRTFDGLLSDTRTLLRSGAGVAAVAALRARYRVVLIDEFQDTDRVQWEIFRTAFVDGTPDTTVVLVGDPKQSIYRFRGAELAVYLRAVGEAAELHSLETNWRSDGPLLGALDRVLARFEFGDPRVAFQPVRPAPHLQHSRWSTSSGHDAALELRVVDPPPGAQLDADDARYVVTCDVIAEVVAMLSSDATIVDGVTGPRPLRARDIAILTRSNSDANTLALRLGEAGVPAASSSNNTVLESEAAGQWRILLRALERPSAPGPARSAALGWFLGQTAEQLALSSDQEISELHEQLRTWSQVLAQQGVPALLAIARASGLYARRLAHVGGERELTDLDHVGELLHAASRGRPIGAPALLAVLDALADPAGKDGDDRPSPDALARRIDRDDDAVQVLTVHKAKGLEFPVVLVPFHWTKPFNRVGPPHADVAGEREIDSTAVAGISPLAWNRSLRDADAAERAGEERRLLYVALTRARHRCIVWHAAGAKTIPALTEVLAGAVGAAGAPAFAELRALADGEASIAVEPVATVARPATRWTAPPAVDELAVIPALRTLDRAWRNWSFSGIKRVAEQFGHGDADVMAAGGNDEPSGDMVIPESGETGGAPVVPTAFAAAPGGTALGTLVHEVLEEVDFTSPTLPDDLHRACAERLAFRTARVTPEVLVDGLRRAIDAPLGGVAGELRLRDLGRPDRLDELGFDLSVGRFRADRMGEVLSAQLDPRDPLRPYFERMAGGGFGFSVDGLLNGSIDLVARSGGDHRYWLADYKTNQLGADREYTAQAMVDAMTMHDYPLQAALYLVALHRYLRWRLPGYDPDTHLGGAAYLFLRGMDPARPSTDTRGVFWWRPPSTAVIALDRLLATGETG